MKDIKKDSKAKFRAVSPAQTGSRLIIFILFLVAAVSLYSQPNDQLFNRRLVWRGDQNTYRYTVEIERSDNGTFHRQLREITTASNIVVSLPAGEYRFRIIPHDILDRPGEGTQWMRFEIRAPVVTQAAEAQNTADASPQARMEIQEIRIDDYSAADNNEQLTGSNEQETEGEEQTARRDNRYRFNTIGVSVGSSFADPLLVVAVHGTFSPVRNMFIEAGCCFGFISLYEDVNTFFNISPFAKIGYFMPLTNRVSIFISAGCGYLYGHYGFSFGNTSQNFFFFDAAAGINLFNAINISYTLKTNFSSAGNLLSVGYVYRFR